MKFNRENMLAKHVNHHMQCKRSGKGHRIKGQLATGKREKIKYRRDIDKRQASIFAVWVKIWTLIHYY
ncbi:TPA: hypothetical protein JD360_04115 [Providencia stuartii]|nr:hypothetical protein [Providencia stuartii]HAU5774967.1 hypothetical protein [Providencia stuartii]